MIESEISTRSEISVKLKSVYIMLSEIPSITVSPPVGLGLDSDFGPKGFYAENQKTLKKSDSSPGLSNQAYQNLHINTSDQLNMNMNSSLHSRCIV